MRFLKWREILIQRKVELFIGGQPLVIVQIPLMNSFSLNYSTKLKQLAKLVNINSNFPTTTTIEIFTLRLNNVRLIFAFCAVHLSCYSILGCKHMVLYLVSVLILLSIFAIFPCNTFNLLWRWNYIYFAWSGHSLSWTIIILSMDIIIDANIIPIILTIISIFISLEMRWCRSEQRDLRICIPPPTLQCTAAHSFYTAVHCNISSCTAVHC